MKKQIAAALVVSLLMASLPAWAGDQKAPAAPPASAGSANGSKLRESIDRATSATPLTARERQDLDTRRSALKTDPVARGAGGIVMLLLTTAISVGTAAYFINKAKKDSTTVPSMARP